MIPAIFGGSFDPVHHGHLQLAASIQALGVFSPVIFIPSAVSAHRSKQGRQFVSDNDRLNMLKAALSDTSFILDDYEIRQGGVNYSYNTVLHIKETYGITEKVGFVMGDDLLASLRTWYRYEDLKRECLFLVADREGLSMVDQTIEFQQLHNRINSVSSSQIRQFIRDGAPFEHLMPQGVSDYIRHHGLYRQAVV